MKKAAIVVGGVFVAWLIQQAYDTWIDRITREREERERLAARRKASFERRAAAIAEMIVDPEGKARARQALMAKMEADARARRRGEETISPADWDELMKTLPSDGEG